MRTMIALAVSLVALSTLSVTPAIAQVAERDAAISACSIPPVDSAACNAAIDLYIAALDGLPPAARDDALADLVVELAAVASPSTRGAISAAMLVVAAAMTDPVRARVVIQVADAVSAGLLPETQVASLLASPN